MYCIVNTALGTVHYYCMWLVRYLLYGAYRRPWISATMVHRDVSRNLRKILTVLAKQVPKHRQRWFFAVQVDIATHYLPASIITSRRWIQILVARTGSNTSKSRSDRKRTACSLNISRIVYTVVTFENAKQGNEPQRTPRNNVTSLNAFVLNAEMKTIGYCQRIHLQAENETV